MRPTPTKAPGSVLSCPGCGATEDAGCVIDLEDVMGDTGVLLSQQFLCLGHERPYWLKPDGADHRRAA